MYALEASDTLGIVAGGWFTEISGVQRARVAALNPATGAAHAWTASADSRVAVLLSVDRVTGEELFIGGDFSQLNTEARLATGAVDLDGNVTQWRPSTAQANVRTLAEEDGMLAVGGYFNYLGGRPVTGLALFDLGATAEGQEEGAPEGILEGEGLIDGEGNPEGFAEGLQEGSAEAESGGGEGDAEGVVEGMEEGGEEGLSEGGPEGLPEGVMEGAQEGQEEGEDEGEDTVPAPAGCNCTDAGVAFDLRNVLGDWLLGAVTLGLLCLSLLRRTCNSVGA